MRRDLLPLFQKWHNDYEVMRGFADDGLRPITLEAIESWYNDAIKGGRNLYSVIYELPDLRPIGYTSLEDIDLFHRVAEFNILIGEKDAWGKGYATETSRLMLEQGFTGLGLHNIYLGVYSFNQYAARAYIKAGFKESGRHRECCRLGGVAYDEIIMDCLATEFQGSALQDLLPD